MSLVNPDGAVIAAQLNAETIAAQQREWRAEVSRLHDVIRSLERENGDLRHQLDRARFEHGKVANQVRGTQAALDQLTRILSAEAQQRFAYLTFRKDFQRALENPENVLIDYVAEERPGNWPATELSDALSNADEIPLSLFRWVIRIAHGEKVEFLDGGEQ